MQIVCCQVEDSETQFAFSSTSNRRQLGPRKRQKRIFVNSATHKRRQESTVVKLCPRQESTVVKLIKAALVRLPVYNQQYFDSEEQLSKANQNKEYHDIPLCVLITLPCTHPIVQRKNNHYKNRIANTIHGCRRISDFHIALNQTAFKWVTVLH